MAKGIFSDLTVVELASVLAGPSVGMFFAELGAKVIKVENQRTGGDVTRTWKLASEPKDSDISAYFTAVNWGKSSLSLDLTSQEGKSAVYALLQTADIVLVSYKPGDAEKLGMDPQTLRAMNPRLIYAAITAYGQEDPRPGFDAIIQAEAGFTYMNGEPSSPPTKMPVALMDVLAAHQLKEAILVALYRRLVTGEGAEVSVSLIGAGVSSLVNQATNYLVANHIPKRSGSEHPNIVPYGTVFETADGRHLVLAVGSDAQFTGLCRVIKLESLATDPNYQTNRDRVRNRVSLNEQLSAAIRNFPLRQLLADLSHANVPAGAIHDMAEVMELPAAKQLLLEKGPLKAIRGVAFEADFLERLALSRPPHLGESPETPEG